MDDKMRKDIEAMIMAYRRHVKAEPRDYGFFQMDAEELAEDIISIIEGK